MVHPAGSFRDHSPTGKTLKGIVPDRWQAYRLVKATIWGSAASHLSTQRTTKHPPPLPGTTLVLSTSPLSSPSSPLAGVTTLRCPRLHTFPYPFSSSSTHHAGEVSHSTTSCDLLHGRSWSCIVPKLEHPSSFIDLRSRVFLPHGVPIAVLPRCLREA